MEKSNISELPKNKQVAIEHHRLDCLTKNFLKRYSLRQVNKKDVMVWFDKQAAVWTEGENRRARINSALTKLRG